MRAGGQSKVPINSVLLFLFTIFYLLPLFGKVSWEVRGLGFGFLITGCFAGALLPLKTAKEARHPIALSAVDITSILELVAVSTGFIIGCVWGRWWYLAPIVLSSVVVHYTALSVAFRRICDFVALPCSGMALIIALAAPADTYIKYWALAGGIIAGTTALYAITLCRVR